ncbi:PAS domain S-box protein [Halosimplex sp. J119]
MGQRVLVVGRQVDSGWIEALEATEWRLLRAETRREILSAFSEFDVDCVVAAEPDTRADTTEGVGPLGAVETVREYGYDGPVVLASTQPDGELAAAATRLGVTEYYPGSTADESLTERVRAHLSLEPHTETADGGSVHERDDRAAGTAELTARESDGSVGVKETATALDAVEDGVYVLDRQGRFVVVNESLADMTGYAPDELVGAESGLILSEDSLDTALDAVDDLVWGDESAVTVSTTIVPKDDEPFPAEDHATLVTEDGEFAGLAGVIRDVSDRRERTRELERYESIIEAVDDGVYALDEAGHFDVVNDALLELTGYDREELLGEHTSVVKDEPTVQLAENKLRELVYGNAVETTFELALQRESGGPLEAEDHMTMLTDDGEFVGTAGVIRDISDRKERERELREAREQFAELLDTSRALLAAHSRERVAEIVADAVAGTLGYDLNVVRLYDPECDCLEIAAGSDASGVTIANRPDYAVGEGGPGRAFERSEILLAPEDFESGGFDLPAPLAETLYVPLGDQGVLSIGLAERGALDERDRSLAEILASNAAVALDRVAYEDELVQYRTVLENVQDMVYVADETGRFSLVTEPLAEWLGSERSELVGQPVASMVEDDAAFEAAVDDVRDGGAESSLVQTALRYDAGERLPAEVEVSPLPADEAVAGTVGVVRDRSELVETREQLETQRDRFTYLFDNLPDAVVEATHDEAGEPIVTAVNDAFGDVFGYDPATISGDSLNDYILPTDERESGRQLDRATASGEITQEEIRREAADGYRDFLFRGIPFETGDEGINSFGIYTDITDQKERERRLQVLNRVLRHNLRNDLNVVMGYAEMIARRVDDETVDEWAETLVETATDVASLSERARSLDRTMREGSLREETTEIGTLVEESVDECREDYPDLRITTDVDDATVVGDGRLELALGELLENSAEHGAEQVQVRVAPDCEDGRVVLSVADDGPGIPEQERAVVDESTEITQLEHASGLGLWVVRWVCDSCGGRLRFEESDLGGAEVVLSLIPADE